MRVSTSQRRFRPPASQADGEYLFSKAKKGTKNRFFKVNVKIPRSSDRSLEHGAGWPLRGGACARDPSVDLVG
jgi:hypothetical protein